MNKNSELILKIINDSNEHLVAESIYLKLKESGKNISMATVYNNLNRLCEEGRVRRLCVDRHTDRFDHIDKHDHLVCKKCGRITDFCFDDLTETLEKQIGDSILSYDLKVDYICPECKNKNKR